MPELREMYHIVSAKDWEAAQSLSVYCAATLNTEGFMHCSYAEQLKATAGRYYPDATGYLLITIDPGKVSAEIRVELARNGEYFPHIYGPLNLDAVVVWKPLSEAISPRD